MKESYDAATVQADFDRLASFSTEQWDHNSHYHRFLLRHLPPHCRTALEIGCGTGAFARLLAQRSEHVLALDLSPEMICLAKERSARYPTIEFQVADILSYEFSPGQFDVIVSIATLHHLPMEKLFVRLKEALAPGGVLMALDLYQPRLVDLPLNLIAVPANLLLKYARTDHLKEPAAARAAWAEHGQRDVYLTIPQVRALCQAVLPGARVKRHLFWRYSLVWKKSGSL
ncbi:MAG TPA: class I SAM-dependent methyltransferase [Ktedonobacteraceae bacterium]|nr:class I SAM-dependent methyltransferase [Ktedonobacteraceae bacterium]